jgi:hypothetical protein
MAVYTLAALIVDVTLMSGLQASLGKQTKKPYQMIGLLEYLTKSTSTTLLI